MFDLSKRIIVSRHKLQLSQRINHRTGICLPVVAMLLSSATIQAQVSESTYKTTVFPKVIEAVFQPNYRQFTEASEQLLQSVQSSCRLRSTQAFLQAKDDFRVVVSTFARIEMYRLGPILEELHQNRLFYWPDKRRVGERHLRGLLMDPASEELTESTLIGKSVAVQGLPALERLLFNQSAEKNFADGAVPDCHVATVIAANIYSMADTMQTGWNDDSRLVQSIRKPSSESDLYRNEQEVLRRLVTQIVVGIDVVLHRKIMPLLGADATIKKAPLWLSEQTIPMIESNLEGIRILLIDSGLAAHANLDNELQFEFRSAHTMLERLALLPRYADDQGQLTEQARSLIKSLSAVVQGIDNTLNDRFLKALGISVGFNSEDGD